MFSLYLAFSAAPQKPLEEKLKLILIHVFAIGHVVTWRQIIDFRFLSCDIDIREWRII